MSVALALAGGGARGDFQVGAAQYVYQHLYETENLRPTILCGTSSGSILAAKLAEGETQGPTRGLSGLIRFWEDLHGNQDMWLEEDWFASLTAAAKMDWLGWLGTLIQPGAAEGLWTDAQKAVTAKSLYNINPVRTKLSNLANFDPAMVLSSGISLRMTTVALESGLLRYVGEDRKVYERDFSPVYGSVTYTGDCGTLAHELWVRQAELRRQEAALERSGQDADPLALAPLAEEVEAAEDALADCLAAHPPVKTQLQLTSLVDAIIASASIPVAFPPVKLGNENCVDGGVRDMIPIDAAIRLGANRVYAICSSAAAVPPARSIAGQPISTFDSANLVDIIARVSLDIMTNEITRSHTDPPNGWGPTPVIIIEPDFEIHDIMTIDPGLVRIQMAHGYMRAEDVIAAYAVDPVNYRALADEYAVSRRSAAIIRLRRLIWEREYAANLRPYRVDSFGRPVPVGAADYCTPDPNAMGDVRQMKRDLKTLIDQRIAAGGHCPPGSDNWWLNWEEHDFETTAALWTDAVPFQPLRHLQVTASPANIPTGIPVQVLVTATENGVAVTNAKVFVNGVEAGTTGTAFTYTFNGKIERVFDPETHTSWNELVDDVITVKGDPYWQFDEETVACDFFAGIQAAEFVSQSVPKLTPGQTASVSVTMKNTGNVTWTSGMGYKLGSQSPQDNSTWGTGRVGLPSAVPPGAQVTFTFNVTAPATSGTYAFQWQMLMEAFAWFGAKSTQLMIDVIATPVRNAAFVSQVVGAGALAGKPLLATWQVVMKNTGNTTWTAAEGYGLGSQSPQDNTTWRKNRILVPNSVPPGQQVTFKFTGCNAPGSEGTFVFQWQMLQEGVQWFGPATPAVSVSVTPLAMAAGPTG